MENNFRGTSGAGVIKALFAGRENYYCRCETCGYKSGREEELRVVSLPLQYGGHCIGSIEEGLAKYFTTERLTGDNQYFCERCNAKVDAEKGIALSKVPYLLAVSMSTDTLCLWPCPCLCSLSLFTVSVHCLCRAVRLRLDD